MSPNDRISKVARRQLDERLDRIRRAVPLLQPPTGGWVAALRNAFAMSQADLARRMGLSQQAVSQLESREAEGSVTLRALEQAAEALEGRLVYAIVPAASIDEIIEGRAVAMAREMLESVRHTMRLEDQETSEVLEDRVRERARELAEAPERLWKTTHSD